MHLFLHPFRYYIDSEAFAPAGNERYE
ncbi:protein of unknown function (plasmid) [Cupriavidus taiwanensis]|uniref:Uncharacterized protein n=1 Tax=Cupriavidus taiwanensis TaxID=164546 RepID=A0A375I654_9BURK|nr:hypothetical protein CT19425_U470012 [Cupriavidus taiwanensis]SPK77574.1 protein of unknown function [Cupriavidus taiwanensis]